MKLSLKAFRGVNDSFEVKFDTNQNLTVLYGENGSGKTTISDALEFVVDGKAGSLEDKSLDGKARLPQLVNAQRKKADLSVSLEIHNKTRSATLPASKVVHSGELDQQFKVLSRKNITRLIEEEPAKRFSRIQDFVSIPVLEREEKALNALLLAEKKIFDSQSRLVEQAHEILEELFTEHADKTKYGDRQKDWKEDILSESEETITEHLNLLQELHQQVKRLRADFTPLGGSYPAVKMAQRTFDNETKALTKLIADHSGDLAKAFKTLKHAKGYFEKTETDICPVCDTEVGHDSLVEKVNQKLDSL
ncbi:AAA family ATPase [Puniceicoccus vermicola]|uniref:AAA family ATPase n=1 Tax=Puniceicoccus vermicola TaxID=388746 RepID=A0A7X1AWW7_9BACT|nr:ATP-binding protein [Puniceicoccus vermicola]MBC2600538.1 AAA family ATPase [Puniceicoccus vermicola]